MAIVFVYDFINAIDVRKMNRAATLALAAARDKKLKIFGGSNLRGPQLTFSAF